MEKNTQFKKNKNTVTNQMMKALIYLNSCNTSKLICNKNVILLKKLLVKFVLIQNEGGWQNCNTFCLLKGNQYRFEPFCGKLSSITFATAKWLLQIMISCSTDRTFYLIIIATVGPFTFKTVPHNLLYFAYWVQL